MDEQRKDEQRKEFERWFYYELGQREKISLIEIGIYTEAMEVAWRAWQAAQASPNKSPATVPPIDAQRTDSSEAWLYEHTPWEMACMSLLVVGELVSFACDVLCAFLLNPAYFLRLCLVMSKRRLRQAGGMLADALAQS